MSASLFDRSLCVCLWGGALEKYSLDLLICVPSETGDASSEGFDDGT